MKQLTRKRNDHFRHKEEQKRLSALYKERKDLWKGTYRRYIDLDEPFRMGFKRVLVLTTAAESREDANVLRRVLEAVQVVQTSTSRRFRKYSYKFRKYVDTVHAPNSLDEKKFGKLSYKEQAYFHKRAAKFYSNGTVAYRYDFKEPELFESFVSKWFVTRVPVLDPDADSRIKEIDEYWDGPGQYGNKHSKYRGWNYNYYDHFDETREEIVARIDEAEQLADHAHYERYDNQLENLMF